MPDHPDVLSSAADTSCNFDITDVLHDERYNPGLQRSRLGHGARGFLDTGLFHASDRDADILTPATNALSDLVSLQSLPGKSHDLLLPVHLV